MRKFIPLVLNSELYDKLRKGGEEPADIAWLFYYYYAQMSPLTRYNSEVGFSVTLGLILGMGRQIEKNVFVWNESQQNNIYLVKGFIIVF